jgi:hypothetical protein
MKCKQQKKTRNASNSLEKHEMQATVWKKYEMQAIV